MKGLDQYYKLLDSCQSDGTISITLTVRVNPKRNFEQTKSTIWEKQHRRFDKFIKFITDNILSFLVRVYEFTMKGNLHVHCICRQKEEINIISAVKELNMYCEANGFYQRDVSIIKHMDKWISYMKKDIYETMNLFKKFSIGHEVVTRYTPGWYVGVNCEDPDVDTTCLNVDVTEFENVIILGKIKKL